MRHCVPPRRCGYGKKVATEAISAAQKTDSFRVRSVMRRDVRRLVVLSPRELKRLVDERSAHDISRLRNLSSADDQSGRRSLHFQRRPRHRHDQPSLQHGNARHLFDCIAVRGQLTTVIGRELRSLGTILRAGLVVEQDPALVGLEHLPGFLEF
jgi:hypothetical protein